jgi:hypothetical protein
MNAPPVDANPKGDPGDEPSVAGVPVRPLWPMVLYAILAASAVLALYAEQTPKLDPWVGKAAAWVFLAFAVGFAAYRTALIAARRYSPFKGFLQVLIAALFFMLLLFPVAKAPTKPPGPHALLSHKDPVVREAGAKVVGFEQDLSGAPQLVGLLDDPSPQVRHAAHAALVRLNGGADLGLTRAPWEDRFR